MTALVIWLIGFMVVLGMEEDIPNFFGVITILLLWPIGFGIWLSQFSGTACRPHKTKCYPNGGPFDGSY